MSTPSLLVIVLDTRVSYLSGTLDSGAGVVHNCNS